MRISNRDCNVFPLRFVRLPLRRQHFSVTVEGGDDVVRGLRHDDASYDADFVEWCTFWRWLEEERWF